MKKGVEQNCINGEIRKSGTETGWSNPTRMKESREGKQDCGDFVGGWQGFTRSSGRVGPKMGYLNPLRLKPGREAGRGRGQGSRDL